MASRKSQQELLTETATTMRLMHQHLFGGDGQTGAIPYLVNEQKELRSLMDLRHKELLDRIDEKKVATDSDIEALEKKHNALDKKVTWYAGGWAMLGSILGLLGTWIGFIHTKGK